MASNKAARAVLALLYGNRCMLCGYRPKRSFTKKKNRNILTFHHILEKSKGGESSVENGALLCNRCHQYLNKQSPSVQREVNRQLIRYKKTHLSI